MRSKSFIICTSIFLITLLPVARNANALESLKVVTLPSTSTNPKNTNKLDEDIKTNLEAKKQNELLFVYLHRDMLWHRSQEILKKIANGEITIKNIGQYPLTPEMKKILLIKKNYVGLGSMLQWIHSYQKIIQDKHLVDPNTKGDKGFMVIKTKPPSDRILVSSVFLIHDKDDKDSLTGFVVTLEASKPYKNWEIAGIIFQSQKRIL